MNSTALARKPGESIFTLILLLFSCVALGLSYEISGFESISAPGVLPLSASVILVLSALVLCRNVWVLAAPENGESFLNQMTPRLLINFLLLGAGYISLLSLIGFVFATFIYLIVSIFYLHRQGWLLAFFVSINSLAVVYIVFRLVFKIILPEGTMDL